MRKRIIYGILAATLCFSMAGCSKEEAKNVEKQVKNIIQAENENVLAVKEGHPSAYPDKTYGEAFKNFFGSPTWEYFVGTKEGPDDDGDGKPDYTEENIDIVEFTGNCTYYDVEVKALLQFTLDKDNNTFSATYLSFNDVPQNNLTLMALLETVFTDGEEKKDAASLNEQTNDEKSSEEHILLAGEYSGAENSPVSEFPDIMGIEIYDSPNGNVIGFILSESVSEGGSHYNTDWYGDLMYEDGIYYSIDSDGRRAELDTYWNGDLYTVDFYIEGVLYKTYYKDA